MSDVRIDDILGDINTATGGGATWQTLQIRNTGLVKPHIQNGDYFSITLQLPHTRKLGSSIVSYHMHYVPIAAANGTILFDCQWGWFNPGDTIPDTLPNVVNGVELTLATTDQYKYKIHSFISEVAAPLGEGYGSIFMAKITRNNTGTWGNGKINVLYVDAHMYVDRNGSINEFTD